jgi:uncharacterized membrane protein YeaQ/YmgE (transglycosylase-associated protein family)
MLNILIWCVYGVVVGSIAKSIIPGEEKMGFFQTIALGVIGSYCGGAVSYLLGVENSLGPTGIIMGIAGSSLSLLLYNKITKS